MMSDKDKKRKYLLFKKDDGRPDGLKPCAFFASEAGCKNGSNCRFLHGAPPTGGKRSINDGNDTMSDAGSEVSRSDMSSVVEEAPPTIGSIRNDHKKRKTNDPADDAPYPIYRVPSVAEDEITKLKDQMAVQQKMFEDQLKMLSSKISTQTIDAPAQKTQTQPSMKYSKQQVVSSIEPIYTQHKQASQLAPKTPAAPFSNGKSNNKPQVTEADSSDDEKFLFSTVNQILENGRSDATSSNQKVAKPVPALINNRQEEKQSRMSTPAPASQAFVPKNAENPFLFNVPGNNGVRPPTVITKSSTSSAVAVVSSSASTPTPAMGGMVGIPDTFRKGTVFAQQEVKVTESSTNKRKNIFSKTKHSSVTTTVVSAAPKVDFKALDYKHLNWEELVTKTQSHPRYKMDYSLNVDQSWVSAKSR
jgi:hypothetical protein